MRVAEVCVCGSQVEIEMESPAGAFAHVAAWRKEHNHESPQTWAVGNPVESGDKDGTEDRRLGFRAQATVCTCNTTSNLPCAVHNLYAGS